MTNTSLVPLIANSVPSRLACCDRPASTYPDKEGPPDKRTWSSDSCRCSALRLPLPPAAVTGDLTVVPCRPVTTAAGVGTPPARGDGLQLRDVVWEPPRRPVWCAASGGNHVFLRLLLPLDVG